MAAPQSSPDLSVVDSDPKASVEPKPPAAPEAPAPAPAEPARTARRGVPIWVLLILLVVGAALFASQYQRAELLDAQVISLQGDLAEAGAQLDAYQAHLGTVRSSVAQLKQQIGSLDALVNLDPIAASVAESVELEAPAFLPPVSSPPPSKEPEATAPADPARDAVVGSALATPAVEPEIDDMAPFGAPGAFQGPGF